MADDVLTDDEIELIDQLAGLIKQREEPEAIEGALVAAYDRLVEGVQDPRFTQLDRMVVLSLFPLSEDADSSSEVQKAADVIEVVNELPLDGDYRNAVNAMPFDPASFIILHVSDGSTKWCKITSTGVKCYTRD